MIALVCLFRSIFPIRTNNVPISRAENEAVDSSEAMVLIPSWLDKPGEVEDTLRPKSDSPTPPLLGREQLRNHLAALAPNRDDVSLEESQPKDDATFCTKNKEKCKKSRKHTPLITLTLGCILDIFSRIIKCLFIYLHDFNYEKNLLVNYLKISKLVCNEKGYQKVSKMIGWYEFRHL